MKFTHDFEKLKYFVKMYQTYALAGKIMNAEQCISKIKANHPVLSRLTTATVNYLIKNCQILFKVQKEHVYKVGKRVDKAVYVLLYGKTKFKLGQKKGGTFGPKMGIGYVMSEETLFARYKHDLERMTYNETLITCEESAFLRIDQHTFGGMADLDSPK